MISSQLPIEEVLPQLRKVLCATSAVLAAPPGSGKTTIVPLALLQQEWLNNKKILMLEPRRLAARAAAARMAFLLGEKVGQTVGYQIRLDRKISDKTRIEVVTEGVLTRKIQADPSLTDVGLVIFDEFHERSIHADLALALCLDLCILKEDLRLLVMSATLDAKPVAEILGGVPIITTRGKSFSVEIEYLKKPFQGKVVSQTVQALHRVVGDKLGDILVFLPGVGEIKAVQKKFLAESTVENLAVLTLYGIMPQKKQDQVMLFDPGGRRRIILATSIAETSLSIEGISCVIDSGLSRRPRFEPQNGLTRLVTQRVSRAAARQRAGRAGRFGPGYCLRLWTQQEHFSLIPFDVPEILTVDLAGLALELALWGVADPEELHWLDPPRKGPYNQAKKLLISLGALSREGQITAQGRKLTSFPLHPRLGHMIQKAKEIGQFPLACDIAALLSERDIFGPNRSRTADLETRLGLLQSWRKEGDAAVLREGGDPAVCARIERVVKQWVKRQDSKKSRYDLTEAANLLVYAYPDRVARRSFDTVERYQLITGRAALLPPGDLLAAGEYLVIPQMDAGQREGRIYLAASLSIDELKNQHSELFSREDRLFWDEIKRKVVAQRCINLGQILIEEKPLYNVDPVEQKRVFLAGIKKLGIACLNWTREARQYQARIHCLREWLPGLKLPDLSDPALLKDMGWLVPYLDGYTKASQLQQLKVVEILKTRLSWQQQQSVEKNTPVKITVPSGSKIGVNYDADQAPFVAVRIQEMYGATDTPAICGGRIPLLLHLLSPAQRPIQITSDLRGFWKRSYPEIKKELKGRYPKHYWPDDPTTAQPLRGVRRKDR